MQSKEREIVPREQLVKPPTQVLAIELFAEDEQGDDERILPEPEQIEPAEPQAWSNHYEVFEPLNW